MSKLEFKLESHVLADWRFNRRSAKKGTTIVNHDLMIEDASGNGNDLKMLTVGDPNRTYLEWSQGYDEGRKEEESLLFKNKTNEEDYVQGSYFRTIESAPINREEFKDGYTIEVIYRLPSPFLRDSHEWMKLLYREGYGPEWVGMDEDESLFELAVSNLREIQAFYFPTNMDRVDTSWSFALDDVEAWYHIAIVNDQKRTRLFVNGVEDFRNAESTMLGIKSVKGACWDIGGKPLKEGRVSRLLAGNLQQIRISDRALKEEEWIVPDASKKKTSYGNNEEPILLENKANYNMVFLPDIQKTVRYMNEITKAQLEWIGKKKEENHIVFTSFLGDIVDRQECRQEWENASEATDILDKYEVPYMVMAGNHDLGDKNPFLEYFGPKVFEDKVYYKNDSPSGYSAYSIFEAGSYTYMILAISWLPNHYAIDLPWARKVLEEHSDLPTIVQAHEILEFQSDGSTRKAARGRNYWADLIVDNDQIFMTICGHNHGSGYQIDKNIYGRDVLQVIVDYQSEYHGGNGWTRFVEFDEKNSTMHFRTFSPWVSSLDEKSHTYFDIKNLTASGDDFIYKIDFAKRFKFIKEGLKTYDVDPIKDDSEQSSYELEIEDGNYWISLGFDDEKNKEHILEIYLNKSFLEREILKAEEIDTDGYSIASKDFVTFPAEVKEGKLSFEIKTIGCQEGISPKFIKIYRVKNE